MNDFSIIISAKNNRNKQSTPLPITQESDETEINGNSTNGKVSLFDYYLNNLILVGNKNLSVKYQVSAFFLETSL